MNTVIPGFSECVFARAWVMTCRAKTLQTQLILLWLAIKDVCSPVNREWEEKCDGDEVVDRKQSKRERFGCYQHTTSILCTLMSSLKMVLFKKKKLNSHNSLGHRVLKLTISQYLFYLQQTDWRFRRECDDYRKWKMERNMRIGKDQDLHGEIILYIITTTSITTTTTIIVIISSLIVNNREIYILNPTVNP